MSSVNFNVGLSNERSSSRVLKPPGGGHTDIFNVKEPAAVPNKGGAPTPDATGPNKGGVAEAKPEAQQKSGRVPPGGFSSGLW